MNIAVKILTPHMPKLQSIHSRKADQMNITWSGSLSLHPVISPQLSSRALMAQMYWQVHFGCLSSNVVVYNQSLPLSCAEAGLSHSDPRTTELPVPLLHFYPGVTGHPSKWSGKLLMKNRHFQGEFSHGNVLSSQSPQEPISYSCLPKFNTLLRFCFV